MYHVGHDELAHAQWKSRRLLAVVSLSFGIGETNCLQGKDPWVHLQKSNQANPGLVRILIHWLTFNPGLVLNGFSTTWSLRNLITRE